jgi:O-antigen/teichoic acid export membrane protein
VQLSAKSKAHAIQISLKLLSLVVTFIAFPFALHFAGSRNFGLFIIITSSMAILTISDLGIGLGLQSSLIMAESKKDRTLVVRLLTQAIATSFTASVIFIILISTAIVTIDWKNIFQLNNDEINIFQMSAFVGCIGLFLTVNGVVFQKILISHNRFILIALLNASQTILSSVLLVFAANTTRPLLGMIIAQLLFPGIFSLVGLLIVLLKYDLLKCLNIVRFLNVKSLWATFLRGRLFLILQVTTLISFQVDNLLIGKYFNPESVAVFGLAWKVASVPVIIGSIYLASYWNEILDFGERPEFTKLIRRSVLVNTRNLTIISMIYGCFFIAFYSEIGKKLLSDALAWDLSLIFFASLYAICACLLQPITIVLNSLHCENFLVKIAIFSTFLNVLISFYLTKFEQQLFGPFVGSILAMVLVLMPCYAFWLRYRIEAEVSTFKSEVKYES